jgi:hypothetical protein
MKEKAWNVRDQTDMNLMQELTRTYKEIDNAYKLLRQAAKYDDAKFYLDMVFRKKAKAKEIEVEILRREVNHGKEE